MTRASSRLPPPLPEPAGPRAAARLEFGVELLMGGRAERCARRRRAARRGAGCAVRVHARRVARRLEVTGACCVVGGALAPAPRRPRPRSPATRAWAASRAGCAPRATRRAWLRGGATRSGARGAPARRRSCWLDERRRAARPAARARRRGRCALGAAGPAPTRQLGWCLRDLGLAARAALHGLRRRARGRGQGRGGRAHPARAPRAGRTTTWSAPAAGGFSGRARTGSASPRAGRARPREASRGARSQNLAAAACSAVGRARCLGASSRAGAGSSRAAPGREARRGRLHLGLAREVGGRLLHHPLGGVTAGRPGRSSTPTACATARTRWRSPRARAGVVFLGDSVTLGDQIKPEEAYPQVLRGAALARRAGRVEVFNVALWGWSTRQERIAYERIARKYRPDQVVLARLPQRHPGAAEQPLAAARWLARAARAARRWCGAW